MPAAADHPPLPAPRNDESAAVYLNGASDGRYCGLAYCGRRLGREAIPGSDGRCGPNDGPQCESCRRFQRSAGGRLGLLGALFPGALGDWRGWCAAATREEGEGEEEEGPQPQRGRQPLLLVAALRRTGGSVGDAARLLRDEWGAPEVRPRALALPSPPWNEGNDEEGANTDGDEEGDRAAAPTPRRPEPVDAASARLLAESLGLFIVHDEAGGLAVASAALRRHDGNPEAAAAWILDAGPEAVGDAVAGDRAAEEAADAAERARNEERLGAVREAVGRALALGPSGRSHGAGEEAVRMAEDTCPPVGVGGGGEGGDVEMDAEQTLTADGRFLEGEQLTQKEQEELSGAINNLAEDPEKLHGVIQIIRESATLTGDEEEIDLEIDQLDTATQRKLHRFVMEARQVDHLSQPSSEANAAVRMAGEACRPVRVVGGGRSPGEGGDVEMDGEPTLTLDGHFLERVDRPAPPGPDADAEASEEASCVLCAAAIPSVLGGSYKCRFCGLCEGCVRASWTVPAAPEEAEEGGQQAAGGRVVRVAMRCPSAGNGSHVHLHPLAHDLTRITHVCDVNNPASRCTGDASRRPSAVWACRSCDFDVCASCAGGPAPGGGFDRRTRLFGPEHERRRARHSTAGRILDGVAAPPRRRRKLLTGAAEFDATAAERRAAARWEHSCDDPDARRLEVVVGTGTVGSTTPPPPPFVPARPPRASAAGRGRRLLLAESRLTDEAAEALEWLQATPSSPLAPRSTEADPDSAEAAAATTAAADLAHAEDLLHRTNASAVGGDELARRAACEAVAAGRLGIAGTLLLSARYAPTAAPDGGEEEEAKEAEEEEEEEAVAADQCWCGDAVDARTAPDGAVGCLGGHAMHAACASDLLLGGGDCPTCRMPLFYPRVARPEVEAAAGAVEAEDRRRREEERERVRRELEGRRGVALAVGDVVEIHSDVVMCRVTQEFDGRTGGWDDEMADACGEEGRITEVVTEEGESGATETRAVKVKTKGRGHKLSTEEAKQSHKCYQCGETRLPLSRRHGLRCDLCSQCWTCCVVPSNRTCPMTVHEWMWDPSLVTLRYRAEAATLWDPKLAKKEELAAHEAERHMLHLRAELRTVIAAREDVQKRLAESLVPDKLREGLTAPMGEAMAEFMKKVSSRAHWRRARHLLALSQLWDDSADVRESQSKLCDAVKVGDLDSAARIVRCRNAAELSEAARWADATAETHEYVVPPAATVELRAYPSLAAPRTGFALAPGSRFDSRREMLDSGGRMWLQLSSGAAGEGIRGGEREDAGPVILDTSDASASAALVGRRVRRGRDWRYGDQDGGEGSVGVIFALSPRRGWVEVQWEVSGKKYRYRAGNNKYDLNFAGAPVPPPQGWLCVRPGGRSSPPVVSRACIALRCFCCGDGLVPPKLGREKFSPAKSGNVQVGDRLFVAATLEPVTVESVSDDHIFCSFLGGMDDLDENGRAVLGKSDNWVWFRPEDLVLTKSKSLVDGGHTEDTVLVEGQTRTRRELLLQLGNEKVAKALWDEAKKKQEATKGRKSEQEGTMRFASCVRGHLLHARCLQGTLLMGGTCPAKGCTEPLWMPKVILEASDGTDCGGNMDTTESHEQVLQTADEIAGRESLAAAAAARSPHASEDEVNNAVSSELKMCPACCSGPLQNENCSDMRAHHGQCAVKALAGRQSAADRCTDSDITYKVSASEIAGRIMRMSGSESVADVLPKCPKHNVIVMFNGCMECGHLFIDTDWGSMPKWDPKAKQLIEIDTKKRKAANLLAKQIRAEAALLQFERDALNDKRTVGGEEEGYDRAILDGLPPLPPPVDKYKVRGCGSSCTRNHGGEGNCLVCGRDWGEHSGHSCREGMRGSWQPLS